MKPGSEADHVLVSTMSDETGALHPLVEGRAVNSGADRFGGVLMGELVAIADSGRTPLVTFPGQPGSAAVRARTIADLHDGHVGRHVLLMFEGADPAQPIVIGVLRGAEGWPLDVRPGHVEIDVDGRRLVVTAEEQLVLRCGRASITLTKSGKVLIEGAYVSSRSSGVQRIVGGSIQLN